MGETMENKVLDEIDIHDRVFEAYYGAMGKNMMIKTQKRIHWICSKVQGQEVLDVGCSQGILTLLLGREGKKATGLDISKKAIDEANEHLQKEETQTQENVGFLHANFMTYDFEGKKYDTIVIAEVLEHLAKPQEFIDKASLLLKSNGILIITVPFGINDFIDHKQTFYLLEPLKMLQKNFKTEDISVLGKWVGFVATLVENVNIEKLSSVPNNYLEIMEKNFFKIERELIDDVVEKNKIVKKVESISEELHKTKINFIGMKARNEKLQLEKSELEKRLGTVAKENEKLEVEKKQISQKLKLLEQSKQQIKTAFEKNKESASYRLGHLLIHDIKNPKVLVTAPKKIYDIWKSSKKKSIPSMSSFFSKNSKLKTAPLLKATAKPKIVAIMDEFTYHSYAEETEVLQLTPISWKNEIENFKPDMLFIESAWKGKDDLWQTKISNLSVEVVELVRYCNKKNIPVMLWNKEDPVHYTTFVQLAKLVDYIFTTDIDCIPKYKSAVNHDRVYLLPFAAQTKTHNPIEKYKRKDACSFAGSYYLRYPERQRDFDAIIDSVSEFIPVEIYDRNYENPHPHYQFPQKYEPMILGCLPFSEIDKAYKGYKFSVNVNTIKQSQTMFARRVFELLASNTAVVSNFSKGVKLFFGDLVIASDSKDELKRKLSEITNDELQYRKFLLQGLRKVMQEHTYKHRLQYIISILSKKPFKLESKSIGVIAKVSSQEEYRRVKESFDRQVYENKKLYIATKEVFEDEKLTRAVYETLDECVNAAYEENNIIGLFDSNDYYGCNYLVDLCLGYEYSDASIVCKASYYKHIDSKIILLSDECRYVFVDKLFPNRAIINTNVVSKNDCLAVFKNRLTTKYKILSVDEFNYCENGNTFTKEVEALVSDIEIIDKGIDMTKQLYPLSQKLQPNIARSLNESSLPKLTFKELAATMKEPKSSTIKFEINDEEFRIVSKLPKNKRAYVYSTKIYTREELNFLLNSQFEFRGASTFDVRSVFVFLDQNKQKISHAMNKFGGKHSLAIPNKCEYIQIGLRFQGAGKVKITELILGNIVETTQLFVPKSKYLVLTKQYPSYDDIYKYGFLHSRVRAYKEAGIQVDIFRLNNDEKQYREFEGIVVNTGDNQLLEETLKTGQYDHVLVHLIDENMWKILEKFIDKIKVTVWVHGAEIQVWQRREYEFERMSKEEIERQKKLSVNRVKFWQKLLKNSHSNLNLVFVSEYIKNESLDDLGLKPDNKNYKIIHNLIDANLFKYNEKKESDRKKILTIRPYASRTYANDLSVKAVELLSTKDFFSDLEFCFVGDGELFDETVEPLSKFSNVKIEKRFLAHNEIVEYHKSYGVFLTPTRMDSQGVSRDEAMSSGLVPVTTNVAAIPEFVDETSGMVVEPENPQALADAIEYLYENPEKFLQLSINASERARKQCGFEQTIAKEIKLITIEMGA